MKNKRIIPFITTITLLASTFYYVHFHKKDLKANDLIITRNNYDTITMEQICDFLSTKEEHYPLSDEFIERYQQTSGGYIDYAKKLGLLVDKEAHEPNQKWHFFTSWVGQSVDEGTLSMDEDAKSRVYSKLLCPELLLWIYEACGVNPMKVKLAKDAAELGKSTNLHVSTIAKNMREVVAWDDLKIGIVAYLETNNGGNE